MKVFTSVKELRAELDRTEQSGIGFVPTMGALHAGHRSLVERARRENPTVVVSVFVNPTQFNDKNDLKHYPRTPEADARLLEGAGADFVLVPSGEEVNVSDLALTSLEMWSFQVSNSPTSLSSAETWHVMNCSTLSFMSLRICCMRLMSSLA